MRLNDLLDSEVVDRNGQRIGHVHDVRLVQDGPPLGSWGAALRLEGLVVGRGSLGARLGLAHPHMRGPWILKLVFGRKRVLVPWNQVQDIENERITAACTAAECEDAFTEEEAP